MEYLVHYMLSSMIFECVVPIEFESFLSNLDQPPVYVKLIENAVNPIRYFHLMIFHKLKLISYVPVIAPSETLCF